MDVKEILARFVALQLGAARHLRKQRLFLGSSLEGLVIQRQHSCLDTTRPQRPVRQLRR
jgi:hypothetical protein